MPGLAENRPSVMKGDQLFVRPAGSDENVREYAGCVHAVQLEQVCYNVCSFILIYVMFVSTKCPNPGVALIWATPLPPLHFTPHEHLVSHGRAHRCMRGMPHEMGSIARLARAQERCNRFPVIKIWATFHQRPARPRAAGS